MALDSVFNHLTQISHVIGFGGNSMTESGSDKASIDRILCNFKDNFHMSTISHPALYGKDRLMDKGPPNVPFPSRELFPHGAPSEERA
jgi:hypothetical protein